MSYFLADKMPRTSGGGATRFCHYTIRITTFILLWLRGSADWLPSLHWSDTKNILVFSPVVV